MQRIDSIHDDLIPDLYPFFQRGFLESLQQTACIEAQSGWHSHYLQSDQGITLPAFIKMHSYGEYVFDWSWAEAYDNNGLNYYPKLIIAAPFTPATGPRLLQHNPMQAVDGQALSKELQQFTVSENLSGAHLLFLTKDEHDLLKNHNWHTRYGVQFHWFNDGYKSFDDFLSRFKSRKRKMVLKERKLISDNSIHIKHYSGSEISESLWQFFYTCYQNTYAKRGMQGYINLEGFKSMATSSLGQQMLMVVAYDQTDNPMACALYFKDKEHLYGRYWGSVFDMPFLHFELCYYQGIEYCIKHGLNHFDPGTQGEHKIVRGFEPIFTLSLHFLQHQGFHDAVGRFVKEEYEALKAYKQQCYDKLPFSEAHMPKAKNVCR